MVLALKAERVCRTCGEPLRKGYFHQHSPRKGRGEKGNK
jgi:hypothetical protein